MTKVIPVLLILPSQGFFDISEVLLIFLSAIRSFVMSKVESLFTFWMYIFFNLFGPHFKCSCTHGFRTIYWLITSVIFQSLTFIYYNRITINTQINRYPFLQHLHIWPQKLTNRWGSFHELFLPSDCLCFRWSCANGLRDLVIRPIISLVASIRCPIGRSLLRFWHRLRTGTIFQQPLLV